MVADVLRFVGLTHGRVGKNSTPPCVSPTNLGALYWFIQIYTGRSYIMFPVPHLQELNSVLQMKA